MKKTAWVIFFLTSAVISVNHALSSAAYSENDQNMEKILQSSQFLNGKFHNQIAWQQPSFGEHISILKEFFIQDAERTPNAPIPRQMADLTAFKSTNKNQLNATWVGHSSLLINIDGYKILTDPVYESKISIVGPTRYNGDVPLQIADLPEIDVVVISHNHYDHLNKFTIQNIHHRVKLFITTLGVGAELAGWGVPRAKIIELDWWQEHQITGDLMIAATPAQHFSGRSLTDRFETLWASWVVRAPNHNIYFSGDSGFFDGFKIIGEKYGPFDMTFMECGAYNHRWRHVHMFPEETVQAHLDLRGKILHPIHWGTFRLSTHPWYDPMQRVSAAAEAAGVQIATPIVGGTTIYNLHIPTEKWWKSMITTNGALQ